MLVGCSSTDEYEERRYSYGHEDGAIIENPNVPASAFAADSFTFYVEPPYHPEWKPEKFYFKDCEETGIGNHISKTSYSCTYP